jgi:hypothetical protein
MTIQIQECLMATREEKAELAEFILRSVSALDEIVARLDLIAPTPSVKRPARGGYSEPSANQVALQEAWKELKMSPALQQTVDRLSLGEGESWDLGGEDDEADPNPYQGLDAMLENHGLTGDQLKFKLLVFEDHLQRFLRALDEFEEGKSGGPSWRIAHRLLIRARRLRRKGVKV